MSLRVKVSSRYQIAIPSVVRRKLGIRTGDRLLVDVRGDHVILMPEPEDFARHLQGLHREVWEGEDPQEYVRRERAAWQE